MCQANGKAKILTTYSSHIFQPILMLSYRAYLHARSKVVYSKTTSISCHRLVVGRNGAGETANADVLAWWCVFDKTDDAADGGLNTVLTNRWRSAVSSIVYLCSGLQAPIVRPRAFRRSVRPCGIKDTFVCAGARRGSTASRRRTNELMNEWMEDGFDFTALYGWTSVQNVTSLIAGSSQRRRAGQKVVQEVAVFEQTSDAHFWQRKCGC